jgi:hypothetical protein
MDLIIKPFWLTFDCKRSKIMFVHRGHGGKRSSSQALKKIMIYFSRWEVLFCVLLHGFKGPSTRKEPKPTLLILFAVLVTDWIAFHMLGSCIGHRVVFITGFQVGYKNLFNIIIIVVFLKSVLFRNISK